MVRMVIGMLLYRFTIYVTADTTSAGGLVPTVTDNAFSLGLLDTKEVGISFAPTSSLSDANGELTFGGIDSSKYIGDITFVYAPSPTD